MLFIGALKCILESCVYTCGVLKPLLEPAQQVEAFPIKLECLTYLKNNVEIKTLRKEKTTH